MQIKCPRRAPNVTMYGLNDAANAIVAICDLSPHSAKNVIAKAWVKIYEFGMIGLLFFSPGVELAATKGWFPLCL